MHVRICTNVMEDIYGMAAWACFSLSWFLGCTHKDLWRSQSNPSHFPVCPFEVPVVSTKAKTYPSVLLF